VRFSDSEWQRSSACPYLITSRTDERLLGSTGLVVETPHRAMTGYVLARDAWGQGFATEALLAMVELAERIGIARLYALCHPEHASSWRVLDDGVKATARTVHGIAGIVSPGRRALPSVPSTVVANRSSGQ
jgi:RimJ/RimL family protein N-acetyltransferase